MDDTPFWAGRMISPIDAAGSLFSIRCPACGMKVGSPCGHGVAGLYVCQARAEALRVLLDKKTERSPHQNTFGSLLYDKEGDLRLYCWIVESRVVSPSGDEVMGWSLASGSSLHPNHFRTAAGATEQRDRRTKELLGSTFQNAVKFEYRVSPKYLGYIPSEDESWLS